MLNIWHFSFASLYPNMNLYTYRDAQEIFAKISEMQFHMLRDLFVFSFFNL